jgi:creatinine amidohydrolase
VRALSWWDVSPRVIERVYRDSIPGTLRSFHGNDGETSVYLAHSPRLVDLALAVDEPRDYERSAFSYHSRALSTSGVVGEPTAASAAKGEEILAFAVEDLVRFVREAAAEPPPPDVWRLSPAATPE